CRQEDTYLIPPHAFAGSLRRALPGPILIACWGAAAIGCSSPGTHQEVIEPASSRVIYGTDDRLEVYEEPDAVLRDLAVRSVVALVFQNRVTIDAGGAVTRSTVPLAQALRVCDDERFSSEPTLAHCSGVLVDHDLV